MVQGQCTTKYLPPGSGSVALAVAARFFINMSYNTMIQWSPELMATAVRSFGSSLVHGLAFSVALASPFVVYLVSILIMLHIWISSISQTMTTVSDSEYSKVLSAFTICTGGNATSILFTFQTDYQNFTSTGKCQQRPTSSYCDSNSSHRWSGGRVPPGNHGQIHPADPYRCRGAGFHFQVHHVCLVSFLQP